MKFRLMHVKPNGVNRAWDILLLDDRQNARVHLNPEGTEFIDLVILEGGGYKEVGLNPPRYGDKSLPLVPQEQSGEFLTPEDNILKLKTDSTYNLREEYTKKLAKDMSDFPF